MKVTLKRVRLSFPNLHVARAFRNEENAVKTFSCTLLLDPQRDREQMKTLQDAVENAMKDIDLKHQAHPVLGEGESQIDKKTGEVVQGYEGMWFLKCKRGEDQGPPAVYDRYKRTVSPENNNLDQVYAGCYVNAQVDITSFTNPKHGGFVRANILGMKFAADGDSFGGGAKRPGADELSFDDDEDGGDDSPWETEEAEQLL